ncbi:MAG: TlpA family protein disulfide reductase [Planctomycetaceae bacterium]|nr:TlpA family protein disulfide reductase [Planctomycetaceae bacterium]
MHTLLLLSALVADPGIESLTYQGELSQVERGQQTAVVKEFTADCFLSEQAGAVNATTLIQESTSRLPWAELVTWQSSVNATDLAPAFGYRHKEKLYAVTGMFPLLASPEPLQKGLEWKSGPASFEVVGEEMVGDVKCWVVESVTGPARKHQIFVQQDRPVVERLKQTVFMGQGDRFELTLQRTKSEVLPAESASKTLNAMLHLQAMKESLERDPYDRTADITPQSTAVAQEQIEELMASVKGTRFENYVASISRDLGNRAQREMEVSELRDKFVGQPAPSFTLTQLGGEPVPAEDLAGKVVVLHFWTYQEKPLEQPYGQIGYLDFLATRFRDKPVTVLGVAVDNRLGTPESRTAVVRSIKRLTSFMKTGYEVTLDTRNALNQFGNPTRLGAELPLWVILDQSGTVVHYHSGYYEIDNQRGLKELDELIADLLEK